MVVGTGSYQDRSEAFPLDKKTLNKIALRSFFVSSARNAETGDSIGWTWALMPGLKKIHQNEEDLALSMGHQLEYQVPSSFFSTLTMGVVLALEQQKADLETIRSVRTSVSMAAKSLSTALIELLALPFLATILLSVLGEGSIAAAGLYLVLSVLLVVCLRFSMLTLGYKKGVQFAEKCMKHAEALKKGAQYAGVFMIGVMLIYAGRNLHLDLSYSKGVLETLSFSYSLSNGFSLIFPGIMMAGVTWLIYHLLTKKNWSIVQCILLVLVIGLLGSFLGIFQGSYAAPVSWPWIG